FICPNNRRLYFAYQSNRNDKYGFTRTFQVYECEDCTDCPLRSLCTKAAEGKNKKLFYNRKWESQKEYIREKLSNEETGEIYGKRKMDVEPFFGFLKANLGFTRMSVRGKSKVHNEMGLALRAVNIRKYTAISNNNGTFSPGHIKNACVYFFIINTSIFICQRLVLSQPLFTLLCLFVELISKATVFNQLFRGIPAIRLLSLVCHLSSSGLLLLRQCLLECLA